MSKKHLIGNLAKSAGSALKNAVTGHEKQALKDVGFFYGQAALGAVAPISAVALKAMHRSGKKIGKGSIKLSSGNIVLPAASVVLKSNPDLLDQHKDAAAAQGDLEAAHADVDHSVLTLVAGDLRHHTEEDIQNVFGGDRLAAAKSKLTPQLLAYMRMMPAEKLHELSMKHLGVDLSEHVFDHNGNSVML